MEENLMNDSISVTATNEPGSTAPVQDEVLDVLTVMLYRMYEESVGQDGDTGRAA